MDVLNIIANILICCSTIALVATLFGRVNNYIINHRFSAFFLKLSLCAMTCGSLWSIFIHSKVPLPYVLTNIGSAFTLCWLAYYKYTNINKL